MLKKILIALVVIVVVFVVVVAMQPSEFRIARTTTISAPAPAVFAQVNDFHNWQAWSPWEKLDPAMKKTYEGAPAGTGAIYTWAGNNQVGEGRMTITESRPSDLIRIKLDFLKPFATTSMAEFTFKPQGNQTVVTWSMVDECNFIAKAIHLFVNMDKMVGGQFEEGLARMKSVVEAAPTQANAVKSGYALVKGLKMYYEIHGTGQPLVLLHGAFGWATVFPTLSKNRQVIAPELQGHGHTADIDRPLTYEQMADDTAALLKQLKIEQADFFGYSMGGTVALAVAIRHPGLVRKLVINGSNYSKLEDAYDPEILNQFKSLPPDFAPKELKDPYDKVAPDPKQWPVLVAKIKKMDLEFKGFTREDMQSIKAHVMVTIGDRDVVRLEHAVEMFRLIPNAQLAVFPGADHFLLWVNPEKMLPQVAEFLDAPMPEAKTKGKEV